MISGFMYFIGHCLHSLTGCPTCRDELGFAWRRFLVKLKWGCAKK